MISAKHNAVVGAELPTVCKTISQPMIDNYGRVNGDNNLMHYDREFARTRGYKDAIAHGLMTFAFVSEMLSRYFGPCWVQGSTIRVKFVAPVYPGDVITTHGTVTACHPEGAGQRLTVDVSCTDHTGRVVLIGAAS